MADGYTHPPVENLTIKNAGVDPSMLAMMAGNRGGGLLGGSDGLLPLLIGAFLFGGGRGMWGLGGAGPVAGAGAFAAEAVAAQSIYTPKDTAAQLNTFQSWAQNNAAALAQQLCTSSANIVSTVTNVNDRLFAAFVAQAQAQTAQLNDLGRSFTDQINTQTQTIQNGFGRIADGQGAILGQMASGFSAGALAECQTQNLINQTGCDVKTSANLQFQSLSRQLAECCCENRLAIANQNALIERNTAAISNQLNLQTCEIKSAISADGQATRALLNDNRMHDLETQLADAKAATREAEIIAAINRRCHGGRGIDVDVENTNNNR